MVGDTDKKFWNETEHLDIDTLWRAMYNPEDISPEARAHLDNCTLCNKLIEMEKEWEQCH